MAIRSRVGSCEWTAQLDPVTGVREEVCRLKRAPGSPLMVGRGVAKERREPRSGRTGRFSEVGEGTDRDERNRRGSYCRRAECGREEQGRHPETR